MPVPSCVRQPYIAGHGSPVSMGILYIKCVCSDVE